MLNIDAVTAAILGLSILLITGVVTWKECLAESVAWDTLTWFAALIAMAGYLNKYGLISWFSETVVKVFLLLFLLKYTFLCCFCMVISISVTKFCGLVLDFAHFNINHKYDHQRSGFSRTLLAHTLCSDHWFNSAKQTCCIQLLIRTEFNLPVGICCGKFIGAVVLMLFCTVCRGIGSFLAAIFRDTGASVLLLPLFLCKWSRSYRCNVYSLFISGECTRDTTLFWSNGAGLLFKSDGWPHSLWHWISTCILWCQLRFAGQMVGIWIPHLCC